MSHFAYWKLPIVIRYRMIVGITRRGSLFINDICSSFVNSFIIFMLSDTDEPRRPTHLLPSTCPTSTSFIIHRINSRSNLRTICHSSAFIENNTTPGYFTQGLLWHKHRSWIFKFILSAHQTLWSKHIEFASVFTSCFSSVFKMCIAISPQVVIKSTANLGTKIFRD